MLKRGLLASALVFGILAASPLAFSDDPNTSNWETQPALETPSNIGGGWLSIGHGWRNGKEGDPNGVAKKKFKCGVTEQPFCTVILEIKWYRDDDERLKVSVSNTDGSATTTAYPDKEMASATRDHTVTHEYTFSVKGCNEVEVSIAFEKSKTSKKPPNIQSSAEVKLYSHMCTAKDETNKEGRLVNADGEKLKRPE